MQLNSTSSGWNGFLRFVKNISEETREKTYVINSQKRSMPTLLTVLTATATNYVFESTDARDLKSIHFKTKEGGTDYF